MSFESRDYLHHILVEADYLIERSSGLSYDVFAADETLRRAFVRSLEIIGEARRRGLQRAASHGGVAGNGGHARSLDSRLLLASISNWSGTSSADASLTCERRS
jgi:hypothetical protein